MSSHTSATSRGAVLIPRRLLVAAGPLGPALPAEAVAAAIGRGLTAAGMPEPDLCPLPEGDEAADPQAVLDGVGFDARMRSARAVVLATARLCERTLAGSMAFEIATRARQAGVPAYGVTAENRLDAFAARIMDLQLIVEADSVRALNGAGRRLGTIV
jgi:hypothetical protein